MQPKLGILAGGGALPKILIETAMRSGREVFVVAFKGQADKDRLSDVPHAWVRLGAAGGAVRLLHEAGVVDVILAGTIKKPGLTQLMPDRRALSILKKIGGLDQGDDSLLGGLVNELEEAEGFRVVGVADIAPHLLAEPGAYGTLRPDAAAWADIRAAAIAARDIGVRDLGQGAVVRGGTVLAVEDRAGTDAMLARVAEDHVAEGRDGDMGGVLVKTLKPGQERRVDLPTVGVRTVEGAKRAGLAGLAIEAGAALVMDRAALGRAADAAGLFVIGIDVDAVLAEEEA